MALTKVSGDVLRQPIDLGITTASTGYFSGIVTAQSIRVLGDLTVDGTTTTLDTNLVGVDRIEVGANSNTIVGVAITQSGTADLLHLYDDTTRVVTVDDEGKVGIGTDNPIAKLEITGNAIIGSADKTNFSNTVNTSGNGLGVTGFRALNIVDNNAVIKLARTHDTYGGGIDFQHWNPDISTMYGRGLVGIESSSMYLMNTTEEGYIHFNTTPSGGSHTERVRITGIGSVGIGTNDPHRPLHIQNVTPTIKFTDTDNNFSSQIHGSSGYIYLNTHNTNRDIIFRGGDASEYEVARITGDGSVGIGTNNPSQLLHLEKDSFHQILLKRVGASPGEVSLRNEGNLAVLASNASGIDFQTGASTSLNSPG